MLNMLKLPLLATLIASPYSVALARCPDPNVSIQSIQKLGQESTTQDEFLTGLAKENDLFGVFTFAIQSESSLEPAISPKYPGPILASKDGSLFLRWSCDKTSEVYGQVDVFQYNGQTPYESLLLDFRAGKKKVQNNPKKCLSCHSTSKSADQKDFVPIWGEYQEWPGMIGARDDFFALDSKSMQNDAETVAQDKIELEALNLAKNADLSGDPCYRALPWPEKTPGKADEALFPFASKRKGPLELRPNFKLTLMFAGQTIHQKTLPPTQGKLERHRLLCHLFLPRSLEEVCSKDLVTRLGTTCAPFEPFTKVWAENLDPTFDVVSSVIKVPVTPNAKPYNAGIDLSAFQQSKWLKKAIVDHPRAVGLEQLLQRPGATDSQRAELNFYKEVTGCAAEASAHVIRPWLKTPLDQKVCEWVQAEMKDLEKP